MEYVGKTKITYEELDDLFVEWVNDGKLEEYMRHKYSKWLISNKGNFSEVFIDDDEIDNYDEDNWGFEDVFYIVDRALRDSNIDLDGEDVVGVMERLNEGTINIYAMSELSPYSENNFELDNNGNILYVGCDDTTKKEIFTSLNITK